MANKTCTRKIYFLKEYTLFALIKRLYLWAVYGHRYGLCFYDVTNDVIAIHGDKSLFADNAHTWLTLEMSLTNGTRFDKLVASNVPLWQVLEALKFSQWEKDFPPPLKCVYRESLTDKVEWV